MSGSRRGPESPARPGGIHHVKGTHNAPPPTEPELKMYIDCFGVAPADPWNGAKQPVVVSLLELR